MLRSMQHSAVIVRVSHLGYIQAVLLELFLMPEAQLYLELAYLYSWKFVVLMAKVDGRRRHGSKLASDIGRIYC